MALLVMIPAASVAATGHAETSPNVEARQVMAEFALREIKECMMCGQEPDCADVWCTIPRLRKSLAFLLRRQGYVCVRALSVEPFGQFERGYYGRIDCQADDPTKVFHYKFELLYPDYREYQSSIWHE
jgi:hypothetical protein